jgi:hypothetical protein
MGGDIGIPGHHSGPIAQDRKSGCSDDRLVRSRTHAQLHRQATLNAAGGLPDILKY